MIVKHPRDYVIDNLQYALNPKSIAVVGASRYSTKVGYKVVDGLKLWGYKGEIYPVNPRADKVNGLKAYPTVKDIPEEVDLKYKRKNASQLLLSDEERENLKKLNIRVLEDNLISKSSGYSRNNEDRLARLLNNNYVFNI